MQDNISQYRHNLRRKAEDLASQYKAADAVQMKEVDVSALLHELQVHQIELEVQNDELRDAMTAAEEAVSRYTDLYDFAPVGYLTLDESSRILGSNLAAATMLGLPRSEMKGLQFTFFIAPSSRAVFSRLCRTARGSEERASGELEMLKNGDHPFYVQSEVTTSAETGVHQSGYRIIITDITSRKDAQDELQKAHDELEDVVERRTSELAAARSEAERRTAEMEAFVASLADGAILFDAAGVVTFINHAGMNMLGDTGGESFEGWLQRYRLFDLKGRSIHIEENAVYRALRGEAVNDMRCVMVTPQGKELTISISSSPVLSGEGKVIGATMLFRDQSYRVAFENESQMLLEREKNISNILEHAVIPLEVRRVPGLNVSVRYEPALEEAGIGGDFYDVFELDDGKVGILIGDVAGKGLAAAVGIAAVRYSIRSYAYLDPSPSNVLTLANAAIYRSNIDDEEFGILTAFFAVIDTRNGEISYASGGHEPALLKTAGGGIERLETGGPLLGVVGGIKYSGQSRELQPGDVVVMVTDGITEARPDPLSLFGIEGVEQYLASSSNDNLDAVAEGILQAAKNHAGGSFSDDTAMVVMSLDRETK